jgi:hypothetical protein
MEMIFREEVCKTSTHFAKDAFDEGCPVTSLLATFQFFVIVV